VECPRCRLIGPDSAEVCDCGYDLLHRPPLRPPDFRNPPPGARLALIVLAIGALVTLLSAFLWTTLVLSMGAPASAPPRAVLILAAYGYTYGLPAGILLLFIGSSLLIARALKRGP
jgi:hypothetical protein